MSVLSFILHWALLAAAVVLAAWTTPDVDFRGGPASALIVAALIAAANVVARFALRVLPSPDNLLLLATLTLLVNGCAVWLASEFTTRLDIGGLIAAVTYALMVTVFSVAISWWTVRLLFRHDSALTNDPA